MNQPLHPTRARLDRILGALPLCGPACVGRLTGYTVLALLTLLAVHLYVFGLEDPLRWWDTMLLSGLGMFALALGAAGRSGRRFQACVTRLHDRGVVRLGGRDLESFLADCEAEAGRWARVFSLLVAAAVAGGFAFALFREFWWPRVALGIALTALALVAGQYAGRMAYYGQLGWIFRRQGIQVTLDPWHADRTGGLRPVGEFYFTQAMIVAIPVVYVAFWLLVMPVWPRLDYMDRWAASYPWLLAIGVALEMLAFLLPLLYGLWASEQLARLPGHAPPAYDAAMNRWRREVDRLYRGNAASARHLLEPGTVSSKKSVREALDIVERTYLAVDAMPTWPVDVRLRRWFAVNNLLLLLPLIDDLIPGAKQFGAVLKAFQEALA